MVLDDLFNSFCDDYDCNRIHTYAEEKAIRFYTNAAQCLFHNFYIPRTYLFTHEEMGCAHSHTGYFGFCTAIHNPFPSEPIAAC